MVGVEITTYTAYEDFTQDWGTLVSTNEQRLLWDLLGELECAEMLFRLPAWIAEDKIGFIDGPPPTIFVGRIAEETEKAIRVTDSAAARPLMSLAHRIQNLETRLSDEQTELNPSRRDWLEQRLTDHREDFHNREDVPSLADEWLPKSQIEHMARRRSEKS